MKKEQLKKAADDVRKYADLLAQALDAFILIPGCPAVIRAAEPIVDGVDKLIDVADDQIDKL